MLLKLSIKNFALIEDISIDFKPGLNVLTGETGAGKSIVIDSIGLILGERASTEFIRTGANSSFIEAVFDNNNEEVGKILDEYGIEKEELLIISREITSQGKNFCRINGKMVPLSALKNIGKYLVDIFAQHQTYQLLFDSKYHLKIIDALGGEKVNILKKELKSTFEKIKEIKKEIQILQSQKNEDERLKERLLFEKEELENASLFPDEDRLLEEEREILVNSEKIMKSLVLAENLLYEGNDTFPVVEMLDKIIDALEGIIPYFKDIEPVLSTIKESYYSLQDAALNIQRFIKKLDFEPERLDHIYTRISFLDRLKKKYGMSLDELIKYKEEINKRLEDLANMDEKIEIKNNEYHKLLEKYKEYAIKLHEIRKNIAKDLENKILKELSELAMKGVQFSVDFKFIEDEEGMLIDGKKIAYGDEGFDFVEFLISTNTGEPLKPLNKIASGGESSRIMLAIKNIIADVDKIPCMIFDEIDTGIGGRTAQVVGEKLYKVAKNRQVLCVTHSPQIACLGDAHFQIKKIVKNNKTNTVVEELSFDKRVEEIARMLGGAEITENTLKYAKEMLKMAFNFKQKK
ncbi:MAG: DNA repair protein RecN [Thermovenabulum sp.]|uniref:DNA repair protein RecN n=1 Tax=Thermovenabulum sp. TaxID=3100335 RepID=UPI003C7A1E0C